MENVTTHSGPTFVLDAKVTRKTATMKQLNERLRRTRRWRMKAAKLNCLRMTGKETL